MITANIVGWIILIASWILPRFIKDQQAKHTWGLILSAASFGIFAGAVIVKFCA